MLFGRLRRKYQGCTCGSSIIQHGVCQGFDGVLAETRARRVLRSLTLSKGLLQARRVLQVGKAGVLAAPKEQLRELALRVEPLLE